MTVARGAEVLTEKVRLADLLAYGTLRRIIPPALVDEALSGCARQSIRRRELPADAVVYYLVALGLYMGTNYREVLRCLAECRSASLGADEIVPIPVHSAISKARRRVGADPLRVLHEQVARPLLPPGAGGAAGWFRQWRLCSLDGSSFDTVDTRANEAFLGKASQQRGACGFPKLRAVALIENGSRGILAAACGPFRDGEGTLAKRVLPRLDGTMFCLADRLYCQYELWVKARQQGAQLLWRTCLSRRLPVDHRLPDGSYLSTLRPGKGKAAPVPVRVIEYQVEQPEAPPELYRLVCSILDPQVAPAAELASLFPHRWQIETAFDELKTHLRGARQLFRSKTPDLVEQEFYALILAHWVVCRVRVEASLIEHREPDNLSFTHAVHVIRRKLPQDGAFSPSRRRPRLPPGPPRDPR
jgi:hypothetical protein